MSAPSDGARGDARKARLLAIPEGPGHWYTDAELAGVIADAKAESLREAADLYRSLGDSLPICAGHVVAELDIRADDWARR